MGSAEQPTPPAPRDRRLWALIVVLAVLLAAAVILLGALWPRGSGTPDAGNAARPVPSVTASPVTPTQTPRPSRAPGTPNPPDCAALYSARMVAAFGDLVLNPAWTENPNADLGLGTEDPELLAILQENDHLTCRWASPDGPSDSGVNTSVVWVTDAESASIEDRLLELDFSCYPERSGERCVTENSTDDGTFGESHFLRGSIWLATAYSNAGPSGYTIDIVDNLWP